jgi:hypothetical protein
MIPAAVAAFLLCAPSGSCTADSAVPPGGRVIGRATLQASADLESCLQVRRDEAGASLGICPGFIRAPLTSADRACSELGGRLVPRPPAKIWSLNVNGDPEPWQLFDVTENYFCDGAALALSCGSLGCPSGLYRKSADAWTLIGSLDAPDVPAVEILAPRNVTRDVVLRGGCSGERPCEEWTYYMWDGGSYEPRFIQSHGQWVDVAPEGLWALIRATPVLERPSPDSAVIEHYPAGSEVIVIGNARHLPYRYISPCNACTRGFVDAAAIRKAP